MIAAFTSLAAFAGLSQMNVPDKPEVEPVVAAVSAGTEADVDAVLADTPAPAPEAAPTAAPSPVPEPPAVAPNFGNDTARKALYEQLSTAMDGYSGSGHRQLRVALQNVEADPENALNVFNTKFATGHMKGAAVDLLQVTGELSWETSERQHVAILFDTPAPEPVVLVSAEAGAGDAGEAAETLQVKMTGEDIDELKEAYGDTASAAAAIKLAQQEGLRNGDTLEYNGQVIPGFEKKNVTQTAKQVQAQVKAATSELYIAAHEAEGNMKIELAWHLQEEYPAAAAFLKTLEEGISYASVAHRLPELMMLSGRLSRNQAEFMLAKFEALV
jgi:hypothetical protein